MTTTTPPRADIAIKGLPGTGKTTTLLELFEEALRDHRPTDIAVSTFRVSMAEEFTARAANVLGGEIPDDNWLRTTHSSCFKLLGLSRDEVVDASDRATVCEEIGVPFSGTQDADPTAADVESAAGGSDLGNILFQIHSWCRNRQEDTLGAWRGAPAIDWETRGMLSDDLVERFVETYREHKEDNGLVDFDGMLERVLEAELAPNCSVLIEDEFQDKSALQVAVSRMWAEQADRVYVGGDPFQAIYIFMGCDPQYMNDTIEAADETRVLDTSYRFGPELWDFATNILRRADYYPPDIEPVGETTVEKIDHSEYQSRVRQIPEESALHLVRANYLAEQPARALRSAGIPFNSRAGATWNARMIDLYNATCKVRSVLEKTGAQFGVADFSNLTLGEIEAFATALQAEYHDGTKGSRSRESGNVWTIHEAEERDEIDFRRIFDMGKLRRSFMPVEPFGGNAMTQTGIGSRSIRKRMKSTWETRGPDPIEHVYHTITTIHGSKGMEADHVFLFDSITKSIHQNATPLPESDEEEARVWFVGATRAAENLHIVDTNSRFCFNLSP